MNGKQQIIMKLTTGLCFSTCGHPVSYKLFFIYKKGRNPMMFYFHLGRMPVSMLNEKFKANREHINNYFLSIPDSLGK